MLCNYLQNVAAITYIFVLQLSTFLFYNKQPGDLSGVVYISLENSDWEMQVMRELENGGLKIAWSKA